MTYSPMTMEAVDAALAAVQALRAPSPHLEPLIAPSEAQARVERAIAAGIPPHCLNCGASLGVVQSEEEGRQRYYAHLPECPAADEGLRRAKW